MAKQKPVKCPYCGQMIDRDYEFDWKKIGNRYWHDECYIKSQEEKEKNKDKLKKQRETVMKMAGKYLGAYVDYQKVALNMGQLIKAGVTYEQMAKSLKYWYEIKHNDPSRSNGGIWIVKSIYIEAENYFKRLEEIRTVQSEEQVNTDITDEHRVFVRPRDVNIYRKKPRFNLE